MTVIDNCLLKIIRIFDFFSVSSLLLDFINNWYYFIWRTSVASDFSFFKFNLCPKRYINPPKSQLEGIDSICSYFLQYSCSDSSKFSFKLIFFLQRCNHKFHHLVEQIVLLISLWLQLKQAFFTIGCMQWLITT